MLTSVLGIEKHSEVLDSWLKFPMFSEQAEIGFGTYAKPSQPFIHSLRHCIVATAVKEIGSYNSNVKLKLSSMVPDFSTDMPWKVKGVSEKDANVVEKFLLSGLTASDAAQEIANNSNMTPWRRI